jgi:hypothetical protein
MADDAAAPTPATGIAIISKRSQIGRASKRKSSSPQSRKEMTSRDDEHVVIFRAQSLQRAASAGCRAL